MEYGRVYITKQNSMHTMLLVLKSSRTLSVILVNFTVQNRVKTPPEMVEAEIPAQAMIAPAMHTGRHPNLNC